jgi:hypothetical protein
MPQSQRRPFIVRLWDRAELLVPAALIAYFLTAEAVAFFDPTLGAAMGELPLVLLRMLEAAL